MQMFHNHVKKQIKIQSYFIRDAIKKGEVIVSNISSSVLLPHCLQSLWQGMHLKGIITWNLDDNVYMTFISSGRMLDVECGSSSTTKAHSQSPSLPVRCWESDDIVESNNQTPISLWENTST